MERSPKMRNRSGWRTAVLLVAALAIAGWSYAAEHPAEHPAEHTAEAAAPGITKDQLADAIRKYVEKDSKLKGGYFVVYDKKAQMPLALTLKKVHEDRLSTIGKGVYFFCADFETPAGKVYDLDIFMKGADKDHLKATKVLIHKEAGVERYTWYEEGGIWKKKFVEGSAPKGSETKGSATKHEHPAEHPKEPMHEGSGSK
jgi:hypothetical protein